MSMSKQLYKTLKDFNEADKNACEEIVEWMRTKGETGTNEAIFNNIKVLAKVAKSSTVEEFVDMCENGEAPLIKLSPKEMELLRGGRGNWWIGDAIRRMDVGANNGGR